MLLVVFAFSTLPFVTHVGSPAMLGGLIVFFACIAEKYVFKYEKPSKLYNILLIIILIIGATAVFIVGGKEYKSVWTPMDNLLSTYLGAFYGMMIAYFLISMIDNEREERRKIKEEQNQRKIVIQKEEKGFVAIRQNGNVIGYIEKEKYDEFVNNNIKH